RGDHESVVPGQAEPGERDRDRRRRGQHVDVEPGRSQGSDDAEEAGIAAGGHDRRPVVRGEPGDRGGYLAENHGLRRGVHCGQMPGGADDEFGGGDAFGGAGRQRGSQHADHPTQSGTVAATTVRPVKSTIATSALTALSPNRTSTSRTRAHSASPAARSSPAPAHSSYPCRAVFAASTSAASSVVPPASRVIRPSSPTSTRERV